MCLCVATDLKDLILHNMYFKASDLAMLQQFAIEYYLMMIFHLICLVPGILMYHNCDLYVFLMLILSVWYLYHPFIACVYTICAFFMWFISCLSMVVYYSRIYMSNSVGSDKRIMAGECIRKTFIFYIISSYVDELYSVQEFIDTVFLPSTVIRFKTNTNTNSLYYADFQSDCSELWTGILQFFWKYVPVTLIIVFAITYVLALYFEQMFGWMLIYVCTGGMIYFFTSYMEFANVLCDFCKSFMCYALVTALIISSTHVLFWMFSIFFPEESFVFYYQVVQCLFYIHTVYLMRRPRSILSTIFIVFTSTQILRIANYSTSVEISKTRLFNQTSVVYLSNQTIVFDPHYNVDVRRETKDGREVITTNRPELFVNIVKQDQESDVAAFEINDFQMPLGMFWTFRNPNKWNMSQIHRDLVDDGMVVEEMKWESNHIFPQEAQQDMIDYTRLLSAIDWKMINESCVDYAVDHYIPFIEKSMEMSMKSTVGELTVPFDVTPKEMIRVLLKQMLAMMHAIFDNGKYEPAEL